MDFLSSWMLAALGALAAPVLIHLWQRRKVIQVHFSTLRYLKLAAARTSRRARLENVLLLLLRCAIFALVALAAARPALRPKEAGWLNGGSAPRTVALIVDRSGSMGYRAGEKTRLEEAKRLAMLVLDDLKPGDGVSVIAADDQAQILVGEPTVDHVLARRMIESITQSEDRSDVGPAIREAGKLLAHAARGTRQAYLFTDAQAAGWQFGAGGSPFGPAWKDAGIQLIVARPDDLAAANAAVVRRLTFQTPFIASGATIRGAATVENFSSAPLHDLLEIRLGDNRVAQRPVDVNPGSIVDVNFEFEAPAGAAGGLRWARGSVRLSGDRLPADDQAYFVLPAFRAAKPLVVEGQQTGSDLLHAGAFLRRALAAGNGNGAALPLAIGAGELDDAALDDYSAVFLADVGKLGDRALVRLERYLQGGGTVVVFGGDNVSAGEFARWEFLPAKPGDMRDLPAGRLPSRTTEPGNPLFAGEWDANTPFPALPQKRLMDWKSSAGSKVLLTIGNNLPLLITGERGAGRTAIVNASADRAWGDFPLTSAFLPLVQQIARWSAAPHGASATSFVLGDAVPAAPDLPKDQPLTVIGPDNAARPLPSGSNPVVPRAEQAGFYEIRTAAEGALQTFAVNADPRESDLRPLEPAEMARITPAEMVAGFDNLRLFLAQNRGSTPLWPVLLGLALLAFAAEGILSNLMARNRSQADTTRIRTGRLNKRRASVPFRPAEPTETATLSSSSPP